MRVAIRGAILGLVIGTTAACTQPNSTRCKQICAQEAECLETQGPREGESAFDEGDCVAACSDLERDSEGRGVVERHADCTTKAANNCAAILACP